MKRIILFIFTLLILSCDSYSLVSQDNSIINVEDDSEVLEGYPNASNSQWDPWQYPMIAFVNGLKDRLFWGSCNSEGFGGFNEFNLADKEFRQFHIKKANADDHNNTAVMKIGDNEIVCAYSLGHNEDNYLHFRRIRSLGTTLKMFPEVKVAFNWPTSYAQIIKRNDVYYIFTRTIHGYTTYRRTLWQYITTKDFITFTEPVVFLDDIVNTLYYMHAAIVTDSDSMIRIVMYPNASNRDNTIRMGYIDVSTGIIYNSDAASPIGTLGTAVDCMNFDAIITNNQEIQEHVRLWDVADSPLGRPQIAFARFQRAVDENNKYYIYDSGTTIEVCSTGIPYLLNYIQNGITFIDNGSVVVGRNDAINNKDYIEIYDFSPNTASATLRIEVYSENTIGNWEEIPYNESFEDFDKSYHTLYHLGDKVNYKVNGVNRSWQATGETKFAPFEWRQIKPLANSNGYIIWLKGYHSINDYYHFHASSCLYDINYSIMYDGNNI